MPVNAGRHGQMINQRDMNMIALGDPNLRPGHRSVVSPQLGLARLLHHFRRDGKALHRTIRRRQAEVVDGDSIGGRFCFLPFGLLGRVRPGRHRPMDPAEPMLMLSGDGLPFFPERMTKPAVTTMQMTTSTNTPAILTALLMLPPLGLRIL